MEAEKFNDRMKKIARNVQINANEVLKRTALNIDKNIILTTPVDTGRARANWQVQINFPASGEVNSPNNEYDKTGQTYISFNQSAILAFPKNVNTIHITNNLPYINRLNDGYSAQAPAKFVQKAIQLTVANLNRVSKVKLLKD